MRSLKEPSHRTGVEWWLPEAGACGKWGGTSQRIRSFNYAGGINPGDLLFNTIPIVKNTILHT